MNQPAPTLLPAHVPPEVARPFALTPRKAVSQNPYTQIIPALHRGPAIFYGTDIFPGPGGGGWVIRRAADLKAVYDNTTDFVKKGNGQYASMIGESWDVIPTELDPPRHGEFRKALNPVFSPKNMAALDGLVRQRARSYIAAFERRGAVEFIREFAIPFPVSIFLDLLGLPQEQMGQFLEWEFSLLHTNDMGVRVTAIRAVQALLLAEIEKRRRHPGSDLISNALRMEVDGRPWTDEEVFGHCFNLFLGGLDTVSANVGLHFYHLATHPTHQAELRANPAGIEIALQELLRAYAAVTTLRICAREIRIHGLTIKPGDRVAMSTPLGSNDPEAFENPTDVRLDRRPAHLSFGHGPHRCLGAHLARRELQIAMTEMFLAIPHFKLQPDFEVPFFLSNIIHVDALPLVWS
jgi:cytochrome P450